MKSWRGWLPYSLLLGLALGVNAWRNSQLAQGQAPDIAGLTVDGRDFRLSQLRDQPALVYFWASWCGVCKAMQPTLSALAEDTPLITVALQSGDREEVGNYLRERNITMPVVLDEDGATAARYGLHGVPAAFVLKPDGTIRFTAVGYSTEWGLRLRLWLAAR